MKVTINQKEVSLTPSDVENLSPIFTFLHGRRFDGNGFKNDQWIFQGVSMK